MSKIFYEALPTFEIRIAHRTPSPAAGVQLDIPACYQMRNACLLCNGQHVAGDHGVAPTGRHVAAVSNPPYDGHSPNSHSRQTLMSFLAGLRLKIRRVAAAWTRRFM